jgi:hypothetical protein
LGKPKSNKGNAFDFDEFGQNVPVVDKKKEFDPFADSGNSQSASTGLEGIDFSNTNINKPKAPSPDDIFGSGVLMPENSGSQPKQSSNPFDAFGGEISAPQQPNPYVSDVFSQNNQYANQNTGGFGMQQNNSNLGEQVDWSSGFSNQFGNNGFSSESAFADTGAFGNQKQERKNSDFSALNPFGGQNEPKTQQQTSKPTGANLPSGVSGFDLFQ